MKLRRSALLLLFCQLVSISYSESFFEKFCQKIRGQAFWATYESKGVYSTCTVSISSKNKIANKRTVCESISPFEVLDFNQEKDSLDCVLGQSYECFSKTDVAVNGKCYKPVKGTECPVNYKLAEIYHTSTARWIGTLFKNFDTHLLISNLSTALVSSFPYSRKEKHWDGVKYGTGKQSYRGIRTTSYKGSSPGLIEYMSQSAGSLLCESTRKKKNTPLYYDDICKMLSETSGMRTFFDNGYCNFMTYKRFNYRTVEQTKGKYCEKIGTNVKSMMTPSNAQFEIVQNFDNKKDSNEQILILTPLLFEHINGTNSTTGSSNHILQVQDYKLNAKMYFERGFLDSRTFDETSGAFYWITKSKDKKYMHLKPYVTAPFACTYGPTKYDFYSNDPICPKDFLRFRGENHKIRCLAITSKAESWFDAKRQCEGLNKKSFLAELTSINELETARDLTRWRKLNESLWIGLRKVSNIPFVVMWDNQLKEHNLDANKATVRASDAAKLLNDESFYFFGSDANINGECFNADMQKHGQWNSQSCQAKQRGFCSFSL
ncbi:unnamed protein product [Auanema sp. JU1783]|nr:unnamed protein product [Auanema sp. JU1783]